jgi:hypothetical protein
MGDGGWGKHFRVQYCTVAEKTRLCHKTDSFDQTEIHVCACLQEAILYCTVQVLYSTGSC